MKRDMAFEKKRAEIDGTNSFYWEKNPKKKQAAVFLHGFPGNHMGLLEMADGLEGKRIVLPDLPACGESAPLKKKHCVESYAKWLSDFFAKTAIKKAIVFGHSFGSRVAISFADKYPEMVEKLILAMPVPRPVGVISRLASLHYMPAKILPPRIQKAWLSNRIYQEATYFVVFKTADTNKKKELIAIDREELSHLVPRATIELFNELFKINLEPIFERTKVKALVLAGDSDVLSPPKYIEKIAGKMPLAEFKLVKNAGHIAVSETPEKIAEIIGRWI